MQWDCNALFSFASSFILFLRQTRQSSIYSNTTPGKKPVLRNSLRFVYVTFFTSLLRVSRTLNRINLFSVEFKVAAASWTHIRRAFRLRRFVYFVCIINVDTPVGKHIVAIILLDAAARRLQTHSNRSNVPYKRTNGMEMVSDREKKRSNLTKLIPFFVATKQINNASAL